MVIVVRENSQGTESGEGDGEGNWEMYSEGSEINGVAHSA